MDNQHINQLHLKNMRAASYLMPEPAPEVVNELIDEIERLHGEVERLRNLVDKMTNKSNEVQFQLKKCLATFEVR